VLRTAAAVVFGAILVSSRPTSAQVIGPSVCNNYSCIQPGMPNYGIAQGSIFVIAGSDNMAQSSASQGVPLQTTLAGVAITVSVGAVTTQAIPYFVSPSQITAILPSKTPIGQGTVTVSSGGESVSASITVVPSAFGLATVSPSGPGGPWAAAVAQDQGEGGQLLGQANAANPGEYLTLWGSGLGPVSGDETQYQTPENLTSIPIEVDIGGVSATVPYHGRSVYPGLDQINVIVPAGVSGCNVSLVVSAGGVPSNFGTIPVAASGRICVDPGVVPVTADEYQSLLGLGDVNVGVISLETLAAGTVTGDSAYATFQQYSAQQFASVGFLQVPSAGSCLVTAGPWQPPLMGSSAFGQLSAGAQINIAGPDGPLALPQFGESGSYLEPTGTSPPILPPTGGAFTFNDGSGGPGVGTFRFGSGDSLTTPLLWTNDSAIAAVERAKGQPVTWSGGAPGSYVYIFGYSPLYQYSPLAGGSTTRVGFTCSALLSAGQFTVPAAALESLPAAENGYFYVANGVLQRFSAPGLDLGLLFFGAGTGISVPFN